MSRAWLVVPVIAAAFLFWLDAVRLRHAEYVTALGRDEVREDHASPTGYAGEERHLVLPGHNEASYRWIIQTQQMLALDKWHLRHVDYDNAPVGHEVKSPSPYRWWLASVAWGNRLLADTHVGISVERAALYADPILHALAFLLSTALVAWMFGAWPACLLALGWVLVFPLAQNYLPALPDSEGLVEICTFGSVLLLLPVFGRADTRGGTTHALNISSKWRTIWFSLAGVMGGAGLWVGLSTEVPVIVGIAMGGLLAEWLLSRTPRSEKQGAPAILPWRAWAIAGATATAAAYLAEAAPDRLWQWDLKAVHPFYALAWLGLGELLRAAGAGFRNGRTAWNRQTLVLVAAGVLAFAIVPATLWKNHSSGFLAYDPSAAFALTRLPGGAEATTTWSWLVHEGIHSSFLCTIAPVVLLLPAAWLLVAPRTLTADRARLALAFGPTVMALGFAGWHLSWWSSFDALWLVLIVAATIAWRAAAKPQVAHVIWASAVAAVLVLGCWQLMPSTLVRSNSAVDALEARELVQRDLAHWLNKQSPSARPLVLAPINTTLSLCYYGGLRGLGTLDPDNQEGLVSPVRILSATTPEEAFELVNRRGVTHFVIPSWESQLDEYAKLGLGTLQGSFLASLHQWALPPWLRPIPYQVPAMGDGGPQSVVILAVVDDQDDSVLFSRIAEYFIEMNQPDRLPAIGQALRRFPADVGALVALANVQLALGDEAGSAQTLKSLSTRLATNAARRMVWERRVALAVLLARTKQFDLAKTQARQCFAEINEAKLRSLTTGSLYHLLVLGKAFELSIADPKLHQLALDLLPADARDRF